MARNTYAIGFIRGFRTHYLATRETNFRRACKTLREMLKKNKRYKQGLVGKVYFNNDGTERVIDTLYTTSVK
jgi:hypothetical protein